MKVKEILTDNLIDGIIIFIVCLVCLTYLKAVYPPASLYFAVGYYILWFKFMWRNVDRKSTREIEVEKILKLCKKPKGRWEGME